MEHKKPHEIYNRLLEARLALRHDSTLETPLLEKIESLPEDNFIHAGREYTQLGAGLAYTWAKEQTPRRENSQTTAALDLTPELFDDILSNYKSLRPQNRYLDEEAAHYEYKALTNATLLALSGQDIATMDEYVDSGEVTSAVAFVEGFALIYSLMNRP